MNALDMHGNTLSACAGLRSRIEASEARDGSVEQAVAAYEREIKAQRDTPCIKHSVALVHAPDGWPIARVSYVVLDAGGAVRGERVAWDRRLSGCDSEGWRVP